MEEEKGGGEEEEGKAVEEGGEWKGRERGEGRPGRRGDEIGGEGKRQLCGASAIRYVGNPTRWGVMQQTFLGAKFFSLF